MFCWCVGWELIDCDNGGDAEGEDVLNLLRKILRACLYGRNILLIQCWVERLPRHNLPNAAMHFERTHRGDNHCSIWCNARCAALNVKELLSTHISAEASFSHNDLASCQCRSIRDDGVIPVRNIGERPCVHKGRTPFKRLKQIRLDCIAQQCRHCASNLQVFCCHRLSVGGFGNHNAAETCAQVGKI